MPLKSLDKAIANLNTEYAEAYYNRGVARHKMGELEAALNDFNEAIRVDPDYAQAYYSRGSAKRDRKRAFFSSH